MHPIGPWMSTPPVSLPCGPCPPSLSISMTAWSRPVCVLAGSSRSPLAAADVHPSSICYFGELLRPLCASSQAFHRPQSNPHLVDVSPSPICHRRLIPLPRPTSRCRWHGPSPVAQIVAPEKLNVAGHGCCSCCSCFLLNRVSIHLFANSAAT